MENKLLEVKPEEVTIIEGNTLEVCTPEMVTAKEGNGVKTLVGIMLFTTLIGAGVYGVRRIWKKRKAIKTQVVEAESEEEVQ